MGFLSDLFGLKTKYVDEETDQAELAAEQEKRKAFFLEPDEAKTLGKNKNESVRSPIQNPSVNASEPQAESLKPTPEIEPVTLSNQEVKATSDPQVTIQTTQANSEVDPANSSMDMFRKMAREIRKP
ncbi:MAG TPA: hypothetical protein DCY91_09830 [Cyanobacteria bacterium UBA11370]|nr:hypothetical protein [Cyanobacteria bacterium UBA11370]HBY80111.1 hypothetical protein [Cyanobacteria bacterium UBA11148]